MVELRLTPMQFSVLQGAVAAYIEMLEQNRDRVLDFGFEPNADLQAVRNLRDILRNKIPPNMAAATRVNFVVPSHLVPALSDSIVFVRRLLQEERGRKELAAIGVNPTENDQVRLQQVLQTVEEQDALERDLDLPDEDGGLMDVEGTQLRRQVAREQGERPVTSEHSYDDLAPLIDQYQTELSNTAPGSLGRFDELNEDLAHVNENLTDNGTDCAMRVEAVAATTFLAFEAVGLNDRDDRQQIVTVATRMVGRAIGGDAAPLSEIQRESVIEACFDPGVVDQSSEIWDDFRDAILAGNFSTARSLAWDFLEAMDSAVRRATN